MTREEAIQKSLLDREKDIAEQEEKLRFNKKHGHMVTWGEWTICTDNYITQTDNPLTQPAASPQAAG